LMTFHEAPTIGAVLLLLTYGRLSCMYAAIDPDRFAFDLMRRRESPGRTSPMEVMWLKRPTTAEEVGPERANGSRKTLRASADCSIRGERGPRAPARTPETVRRTPSSKYS